MNKKKPCGTSWPQCSPLRAMHSAETMPQGFGAQRQRAKEKFGTAQKTLRLLRLQSCKKRRGESSANLRPMGLQYTNAVIAAVGTLAL
ncbi:MAG: hypothetical protein FWC27_06865 [Firmicutes bacterium]|nr:hypothetical protein [Bacillota bacterium]